MHLGPSIPLILCCEDEVEAVALAPASESDVGPCAAAAAVDPAPASTSEGVGFGAVAAPTATEMQPEAKAEATTRAVRTHRAVLGTALPESMSQREARRWIPEGTSIWRGNLRGEWWGHCPPNLSFHAKWSTYTEAGALKVVIRRLWREHLSMIGRGVDACPYPHLFEDGA